MISYVMVVIPRVNFLLNFEKSEELFHSYSFQLYKVDFIDFFNFKLTTYS